MTGTAKSFFIDLDSPIKAIALNGDGQQVVAAGRNSIRIFSIEDDKFVEKENLRFAKRNLNGTCTDVAWNPNDENELASSTTAGAVYLWTLSNTATRQVCFHPKEANYLLSGSTDATAILFDLRAKGPSATFRCEEAVRDVRFNPHHYFQFAVCLENGNVQLFDYRKADMCEREFTCHAGPVFQSHFHPSDKSLLATCGRDKCIKVWRFVDEQKNPALDALIPTIAAIGCLAWRPERQFYLASAAMVTDFAVNVWDLRRPFVPFAAFDKHTDVVTALAWRDQDPHILLSAGKDGWLSQFTFRDARRPADKMNPVGMDIGCYGDLAQACGAHVADGNGQTAKPKLASLYTPPPSRAQEFAANSVSKLTVFSHSAVKHLSMEWMVRCAREYQLCGRSISDLCNHNAGVAERVGRGQVALVWRVVGFLYSMGDSRSGTGKTSHLPAKQRHSSGNREDLSGRLEDGDHMLHHRPPTRSISAHTHPYARDNSHSLALEPVSSNAGDFLFNEQTVYEEVDAPFFPGMDGVNPAEEAAIRDQNWHLPSEGFQVRKELPTSSQSGTGENSRAELLRKERDRNRSGSLGPEEGMEDGLRLGSLMTQWTGSGSAGVGLDFHHRIQEAIHHHAHSGDIQTAVSLVVVLGDRARNMVVESELEAWLLDYIELLWRFELYAEANEIQKLCGVPAVAEQNQQSTTVYTACNRCGRHLAKSGWYCTSCHKLTNPCSICQLTVRGLYVWCQGYNHGGHLQHMQEWFRKSPHCPTGCGHYCELI